MTRFGSLPLANNIPVLYTHNMCLMSSYQIHNVYVPMYLTLWQVYCGLRNGKVISIKIDLSHYYQCQVCVLHSTY